MQVQKLKLFSLLFYFLQLSFQFDLKVEVSEDELNNRPVIGILLQPAFNLSLGEIMPQMVNESFFPASYVKWMESAGAQIIPIPYDVSHDELARYFRMINGLLIPGGNIVLYDNQSQLSYFQKQTDFLLKLAIAANDLGDIFPVYGTCQGYEQMIISAGCLEPEDLYCDILNISDTGHTGQSTSIKYLNQKNSWLYKDIPKTLKNFSEQGHMYFHHSYSLLYSVYQSNKNIHNFYEVVATAIDAQNQTVVATMEARRYPFILSQYHPEKTPFEYHYQSSLTHEYEGIVYSRFVGDKFVNIARLNHHTPNYSYVLEYQNRMPLHFDQSVFDQLYLFNDEDFKQIEQQNANQTTPSPELLLVRERMSKSKVTNNSKTIPKKKGFMRNKKKPNFQ